MWKRLAYQVRYPVNPLIQGILIQTTIMHTPQLYGRKTSIKMYKGDTVSNFMRWFVHLMIQTDTKSPILPGMKIGGCG